LKDRYSKHYMRGYIAKESIYAASVPGATLGAGSE
jgi:hypothetical protein